MPKKPIDAVREVIEWLRQKHNGDERISRYNVVLAFRFMISRNPKIVSEYLVLAEHAGILTKDGDNYVLNYQEVYKW